MLSTNGKTLKTVTRKGIIQKRILSEMAPRWHPGAPILSPEKQVSLLELRPQVPD